LFLHSHIQQTDSAPILNDLCSTLHSTMFVPIYHADTFYSILVLNCGFGCATKTGCEFLCRPHTMPFVRHHRFWAHSQSQFAYIQQVLKLLLADEQVVIYNIEDYSQKAECKLTQIRTEHGLTTFAQKHN